MTRASPRTSLPSATPRASALPRSRCSTVRSDSWGAWAVNAAAGYPVEQLILTPQTQERFETVALAYTPPNAHWDGSLFAATQQFQGLRDRQAVGLEGRFLASHASLVAVLVYDTAFHSLNTASMLGTLQL